LGIQDHPVRWGEKEEFGNVVVDRNRMIQLVIDEYREKRLNLYNGTENDWYDFWLHWSHIYRVTEENTLGVPVSKWLRSDRDDWVHASVYWRAGMDRFMEGGGSFIQVNDGGQLGELGYMASPDGKTLFQPTKVYTGK